MAFYRVYLETLKIAKASTRCAEQFVTNWEEEYRDITDRVGLPQTDIFIDRLACGTPHLIAAFKSLIKESSAVSSTCNVSTNTA